MDILEKLFELQDLKYKDFNQKLILNIDKDKIIGIKVPVLRKFAKDFYKNNLEKVYSFMNELPHFYMEENNLHLFFIENIKDFKTCMEYTQKILPYIDNWQSCDIFLPKIFKNHKSEVYEKILLWINSKDIYTVRFSIKLLMTNYMDKDFKYENLEIVSKIKSDNYYINMARAWYFQNALYKKYNYAIKFIENRKLDTFTHNKAIQKSIESKVISMEKKNYLKSLKIKV